MTITSGNGAGPAHDSAEQADRAWLRAQAATVPAHWVTVVQLGAHKWTPVCHTCGPLGDYPYELGARFAEQTHEQEHA